MRTIVVGVDGSKGSVEALRFALETARALQAEVRAVTAWHVPPAAYGAGWSMPVDAESYHKDATARLLRALWEAGADAAEDAVTPKVVLGDPVTVLCDEAETADMLVVGTRGRGGIRSLVYGSVSHACAQHTPCPIVIVPHRAHAAEAAASAAAPAEAAP